MATPTDPPTAARSLSLRGRASGPKRVVFALGALLLSSLFAVTVVAEGILRVYAPDPLGSLYFRRYDVAANCLRYRADFLERYPRAADLNPFYEADAEGVQLVFDPELGWDTEAGLRLPCDVPLDRVDGERRIVVVGDSFAYGYEVEPDACFAHRLRDRLGSEVVNMGVGGYGLDQAAEKYFRRGSRYRPDLVIYAVFPGDLERAAVDFFTFPKPRYESRGDQLTWSGLPYTDLRESYARLEAEVAAARGARWRPRVHLLARRLLGEQAWRSDYRSWATSLVRALLDRLMADVGRDGLLVLSLPQAPLDATPGEDEVLLLETYREAGVHHLDLRPELLAVFGEDPAAAFVRRDDGSLGHLSRAGNRAVAERIARYVEDHALLD